MTQQHGSRVFPAATYQRRRQALQEQLGVGEAMLVSSPVNVTYLSGFTGDSSLLLLDARDCWMLSDGRYQLQLSEQCPELPVLLRDRSERIYDFAVAELKRRGYRSLRVETHAISFAEFQTLQAIEGMDLTPSRWAVETMRAVKDDAEIELIQRAVKIAERAFQSLIPVLSSENTEQEVALRLEYAMRQIGADGVAFPLIVAAGPQAALPHAEPGPTRLGETGHVLIDWGATYLGYRSDLTRVLVTSRIPAEIARAYEVVEAARSAAIAAIRPGVSTTEVGQAAARVLAEAGLIQNFNHGLGHGIGLEIHELPFIDRDSTVLQPGMVITIEPGVYFPGTGGIRIEDDVLVTAEGARILSTLPRRLDENQIELID